MTTLDTFCGFVAIVGRPNVGKSTLVNRIVGQKVSITSKKAQTTRHRVLGIHTKGAYQTVYIDTPGLHSDEKRAINRLMNRAAHSSIADVALVLFMVEGTNWYDDDDMVLKRIKQANVPCILVINKVDNVKDKEKLLPHLQLLASKHDFKDIIPISAESGSHVDTLEKIVEGHLDACEHYFPEDHYTDRSARFMVSEAIREKLMRNTGDELPYDTAVEIEQFKYQPNGVLKINAAILVSREPQKRIVIGKGGEKIKVIGRDARVDIEQMMDCKVYLELFVKVKSGWADDERALRSLGYGED